MNSVLEIAWEADFVFKNYYTPRKLCLIVFLIDFPPLSSGKADSWSSCSEILKQNRLVNYEFG